MDVSYRLDKEILYIAVEGRIDASNAAVAEVATRFSIDLLSICATEPVNDSLRAVP